MDGVSTGGTELLRALQAAVYTTDAEGRISFYNEAAAELWGFRPQIGVSKWCGSWRLYWPDGRPMPHSECPMAVALREGRPCLGREAVAERPDGSRISFVPFPSPLKDASGQVTGGINLLVDITDRKEAEIAAARLAAIVASSDDAIVSKTLDGIVTSWNGSATRIFGYGPEEMIGQSIKRIIPPELQHEEDEILAKLGRGERIDHFDTVRVAKGGRRVEVSLTVSPVRDGAGTIVGASKVARDIGERKRQEEMQRLLLEELNHRVKNTLASIQAIASQSVRTARNQQEFVGSFTGRLQALARAHDLLVQSKMKGMGLIDLLRQQVALGPAESSRVSYSGPDVMLEPRIAVQTALVLHELATNARKYGALSVATGRLSLAWTVRLGPQRQLCLSWKESGVQRVTAPRRRGFGSALIERSLSANGGKATVRYAADGLKCQIMLPLPEGAPPAGIPDEPAAERPVRRSAHREERAGELRGKRVLIVEDEALVAMDMEAELAALGVEVVGPATSVAAAEHLIGQASFNAALVDANLHGHPADRVAAALTRKRIPFAFATGYGRGALPEAFRHVPMLAKPFEPQRLVAVLLELLPAGRGATVIPLRQGA